MDSLAYAGHISRIVYKYINVYLNYVYCKIRLPYMYNGFHDIYKILHQAVRFNVRFK